MHSGDAAALLGVHLQQSTDSRKRRPGHHRSYDQHERACERRRECFPRAAGAVVAGRSDRDRAAGAHCPAQTAQRISGDAVHGLYVVGPVPGHHGVYECRLFHAAAGAQGDHARGHLQRPDHYLRPGELAAEFAEISGVRAACDCAVKPMRSRQAKRRPAGAPYSSMSLGRRDAMSAAGIEKSALGGIAMATSFTSPRRSAGFAIALLLMVLGLPRPAEAQSSGPLVTASSPVGLNHPTGWGTILQTAIDTNGDWLVEEYPDGGLFEFPANGGPMITLVPLGGLGSINGYQNPAVLLDPNNNLYVGGNWNNCLLMFPYNPATRTWSTLSVLTASNNSADECGTAPYTFAQYGIFGFSPYYFQPWGIAIGNNNNIIVGSQNSGNFIFSMAVQSAWSNPSVTQSSSSTFEIISSMTKRPTSIAVDPEGDIFFVEDSGGLPGVYEITAAQVAAGQAGNVLTTDAGLPRVDPDLPNVTGVITDPSGNLYISDGSEGVFVVPNPSGTPETSAAYQVSAVPAQGEVAIDWARNILYVPTTQKQNNGQADVAKVYLSYAELGSSPVQTMTADVPVSYTFNGSVTPANFVVVEDGNTTPDFSIDPTSALNTCSAGAAYAAGKSCSVAINFTPHSVGSISAKLQMLDKNGNVLASTGLHGTGTGALMQASPALESNLGASGSLNKPSQVAVDGRGNVYVADAGKGAVLMYAAGAGSPATAKNIGTGLTAPTGVAVDGAGDVFIADSGKVYEVPFGPTGLNAGGQVVLASGLGGNLQLAADGLGNVYVADPSNARVVKLSKLGQTGPAIVAQSETMMTTGFTAPSAVAVDSNNNLYVIDGANLF